MKYHILHVFRTSIEFIKKSSDHFKYIYKLKLLTRSFDVNMTSFLKGVPNYVLNLKFITPPRNDVRLISKFCQELHFMKIFKMIRGFFLKRSRSYKIMHNAT